MAYEPGIRIPRFSNPNVFYDGQRTGVPVGQEGEANNALTIDNTAFAVANWNQSCPPAPLSVTLTSVPDSGEVLCTGTPVTLSWIADRNVYAYQLDLSTNAGGSWVTQATGVALGPVGSHEWIAPSAPIVQGRWRVRIDACSGFASDEATSDFSTSSAVPLAELLSPNGGEVFCAGTVAVIRWSNQTTSCPAETWQVDYARNGTSFQEIGSGTGNGEELVWDVDPIPTTQGRIRIRLTSSAGSSTDTSEAPFSIVPWSAPPDPQVLVPNGGESWGAGTTRHILWENLGCGGDAYWIEYSSDGGATWSDVHTAPGSGGDYAWTVPLDTTTQGRIRVYVGFQFDVSDATFTIHDKPTPYDLHPSGGETWVAGSQRRIAWSNSGGPVSSRTIEVSLDGGGSWSTIASDTSTDDEFVWEVPSTSTTQGLVRVVLGNDVGSSSTASPGVFSIVEPEPFIDVTVPELASIGGEGVSWIDADTDGDVDLVLSSPVIGIRLFENDGFGDLADATPASFSVASGVRLTAWADIDEDGDLDVYSGSDGSANRLFRNDGGLMFTDVTSAPLDLLGNTRSAVWADHDLDGDVDLFVARLGQRNALFRNDGAAFSDMTAGPLETLSFANCAAWADADGDRDPDLLVVNVGASVLFRNDGGSFVDATPSGLALPAAGIGGSWGDFDGDSDADLHLSNIGANRMLRNDGGLAFADVTSAPLDDPGSGAGTAWVDFDLDGDLDLTSANQGQRVRLLRNDGASFVDVTPEAMQGDAQWRGLAWADVDRNGAPDLFVANAESNGRLLLNFSSGEHRSIGVDLVGTTSNRSGIGATIRVERDGGVSSAQVAAGSGYESQSPFTQIFGLGSSSQADLVEISWPSGARQTFSAVPAGERLTIVEVEATEAVASAPPMSALALLAPSPNPFHSSTRIAFEIPDRGTVRLRIYDVAGRLVRTLHEGELPAGRHELRWDGTSDQGESVESGVYFSRIEAFDEQLTRRLLRIR
jgi:hypothetical protein